MDCAEHDRCCRVHGGCLNPFDTECGDEFQEAADGKNFWKIGWRGDQIPTNLSHTHRTPNFDLTFATERHKVLIMKTFMKAFTECQSGQQDDEDGITLFENACTLTPNGSIWHDADTHAFCREIVEAGCDITSGVHF